MSRSCHSATFSSAAWALPRSTRARPEICSALDRVALVRHRRASPSGRRGRAPAPRAPRCAAGGGSRSRSARGRRRRARSRPAARRGGRGRRPAWRRARARAPGARARAPRTRGWSPRRCRPRPRSRRRPTCANARSRRCALRCASKANPASFTPNVVGSACTPWVRPTHSVSDVLARARRERRDELARARHEHLAGGAQLQRERGVEHVRGGQAEVDPAPGLARRGGEHVDERGHVVVGDLLALVDRLDGEAGARGSPRARSRRDRRRRAAQAAPRRRRPRPGARSPCAPRRSTDAPSSGRV